MLDEGHGQVMLEIGLLSLLFFWGAHSHLRFHSLPEVIEGGWGDPHEVAVNLQRSPVLIVDEDTDGQTLHFFSFEHSCKALFQIWPNEKRLSIIYLNSLYCPAACLLPCVNFKAKKFCHSRLICYEIFGEVELMM